MPESVQTNEFIEENTVEIDEKTQAKPLIIEAMTLI